MGPREETDGNKQDAEPSAARRAEGLGKQVVQRLSFTDRGCGGADPCRPDPALCGECLPRPRASSALQADRHCAPRGSGLLFSDTVPFKGWQRAEGSGLARRQRGGNGGWN